jgi:ubiquinone/menaquinone biosynthesis C-methylase UbiE
MITMTMTAAALTLVLVLLLASSQLSTAFVARDPSTLVAKPTRLQATTTASAKEELAEQKRKLFQLLRTEPVTDAVLADPITKEGVIITSKTTMLGGQGAGSRIKYQIKSPSNTFAGTSDSFLNLLEPITNGSSSSSSNMIDDESTEPESATDAIIRNLTPFIPPPLRSAMATAGLPVGTNYIPMRDLFTSPAVSLAYERGWRQGFQQAGFPGPDKEAAMAMEYFQAAVSKSKPNVLVDMSCATGLFTRRFAKSGKYDRVLGCDYSASMLDEARRRIQTDETLRNLKNTQLDLVRLDVGQIPMQTSSVDALNAGAAMHCWPELPQAAAEIYRVLKPGGRYFATTFLSAYFSVLQQSEGGASGPSRQAFQYFESMEQLRSLMESGGFEREKIQIEVLGNACVVIRCEK